MLLARLNKGDRAAAAALTVGAHKLLSGLETLTAKGDRIAANLLLEITGDATARFYQSAHRKPALFLPHTRRKLQIPAPVGRNKQSKESTEAFIEKMELAKNAIFKGTRWAMGEVIGQGKFSRRAYRFAFRLIGYVESVRTMLPIYRFAADAGRGPQLPDWIADAENLKRFGPQTWRKWAEVAWTILKSVSPDGRPASHPALKNPATAICTLRHERIDPYFGKIVKAPSIADNDMKEALFSAFRFLATGKSK
jgi:hypothetical protein